MTTMVEVLFEDQVLKPLGPIEGLKEHEKAWAVIRPLPRRDVLRRLVGTLTHEEARKMRESVVEEEGQAHSRE